GRNILKGYRIHAIKPQNPRMRIPRTVRAVALAESSIGFVRTCASRPRFLCTHSLARTIGINAAGRGKRYFSQSLPIRAGAAEAVLRQAAADPSALTQETIIDNLDQVEKGRLARIR